MSAGTDILATMPWSDCLVPPGSAPAELVAYVRRSRGGYAPSWVSRFAALPWLVHAMNEMTGHPFASLRSRDFTFVSLVVSRDNSCRFCYGAQRAMMRMLGYEVGVIERLERDELIDSDPRSQLAIDFARKLSRSSPRPGAPQLAALGRSGRSPDEIAELTFAAACTVFANRVSTLVALPPESIERARYQLAGRLLRPVLSRWFKPPPRRTAAPPVRNEGVGASVVAALGTSPSAGVLRRAIDAALDSPVLPRRTKLLMMAVIARALQCAHCEHDLVTALHAAGVPARDVAQVLDHLAAPGLDPREAQLVPFARETVRCTPTDIQQRLRTLAASLDLRVDEILEVVGVAAVGNALCRASVLLEQC
jgi:alkylhydroperoxidase family enzyme